MKLTKIAIALAAMLAMSALVVSAASAAQYRSNSSPVMLHGVQEEQNVFTVDGQKVTCNVAEFNKASQATPANEITGVIASYSNCTAFGFAGASVNMGNCTYTLKQPNEIASLTFTLGFGFFCSGGTPMTIKSSVFGSECEVTLSQTGNENLFHIVLHVNFFHWRWTFTFTGIRFNKVKDNGLCPLSGTGVTNNGTYNGSAEVEGTEEIGIYVE